MRQFIITIIALGVLLGSLVAVLGSITQKDYMLRGYRDATQTSDLPYRMPRFGVNADLTQYSDEELAQHMAWMREANVTWVRQIFDWRIIEPEPQSLTWQPYDSIVEAIAESPDLQLVAVITGSPDWSQRSDLSAHPTGSPDDLQAYQQFIQAFAQRYGEDIHVYQIWEEPNIRLGWGDRDPNVAEYVAILQIAYDTIHANDADAIVLAAALAPTVETGRRNINEAQYLREMYAVRQGVIWDGLAVKAYGFDESPSNRDIDLETLNFSRVVALREIMEEHGDGKIPLWLSNWGWNSLPSDWRHTPSIWGQVSADERITYTLDALTRVEREWSWVGGMILHHWQPNAPTDDPQWGFALVDADGNLTPLLEALFDREVPDYATNGLFHPRTPYAQYQGIWTFSDLGADIGWLETSDSRFQFNFQGRDVALLLNQGDYVAFLYPWVDNEPGNVLPRDNQGNPYIFLRSESLGREQNLVPVARNLANSPHQLDVLTDKGWDQWALAGYAVSSGDLAAAYNNQIAAAIIAFVISATATIISAYHTNWKPLTQGVARRLNNLSSVQQLVISGLASIALMLGMVLTWGDAVPNILRREPIFVGSAIVTAGLLYLQWHVILVVLAAIILYILILHRLQLGLILTIFFAPFFLFPVELFTFSFPMSEILIGITGTAWVSRVLIEWGYRYHGRPYEKQVDLPSSVWNWHLLDYAILGLLGLACISLLWTTRTDVAFIELRRMIVEPAIFYLVLRTTYRQPRDLLQLVDTLLIAGLMVATIGLIYYATGQAIITAEDGARRLASIYGSPNNVALFIGRCLPFALTFALLARSQLRRTFAWLLVVLFLITGILTQSVGGLLFGFPAAIIIVIGLIWRRKALPYVIGVSALLAVGLAMLTQISARFANLLDFTTGTNFIRLRVWESAFNVVRDFPITGIGLDQFLYVYRGQYIRPDAIWDPDLSHPHNILLDFWIRLGLLGLILLLVLQIIFWRNSLLIYRKLRQSTNIGLWLIIGAMGSMASLVTHGLIDNSVFVMDLAFVFVLLVGIVACLNASLDSG